jgi:iron complex outermembrane recepter protein
LLYVSPQNMAWQNNMLLQTVVPVRMNEWWNITTTITGGWKQFKVVHTLAPVTKGYISWSVNHLQTFLLPKKYSAELSGWFNSQGYNGSVRTGAVGVVNAGLKKELNKSRGVLQLSVSDVFSTMKFTSRYGTITRDAYDVTNKVEFYTETAAKMPVFRLSYTRSFGSSAGKSRNVSSGSAEEKERVNKE